MNNQLFHSFNEEYIFFLLLKNISVTTCTEGSVIFWVSVSFIFGVLFVFISYLFRLLYLKKNYSNNLEERAEGVPTIWEGYKHILYLSSTNEQLNHGMDSPTKMLCTKGIYNLVQ